MYAEQLKYINHLGEELNFGRDGLYVNENDLHDFTWDVLSANDRISGFERGMQTRSIPARVACVTNAEGISKRNRLFEIPEKDVLSQQYGRLIVNGYYCECYITGSKKNKYNISDQYMAVTLTVTTDRPYWVKESKLNIKADPSWKPTGTGGIDFPFDFPFDFLPSSNRVTSIKNDNFYDTAFRMVIHGQTINPTVIVNDHEYQVNTPVYQGKILTINSMSKKVFLSNEDGTDEENVFDLRGRDHYIFQPIPAGEISVTWDNSFDVDLYILEERSEPKWHLGE